MPLATEDNIITQLENYGLEVRLPLDIGTRQRVPHQTDKRGAKSGWYIVFENSPNKYSGSYGCWKLSDQSHTFSGDAVADVGYKHIKVNLPKEEFIPDFSMWENAESVGDHQYLKAKGIEAYGQVRQFGDHLMIPIYDNKTMVGLQTISGTGKKHFVKGSKFNGSHFTIAGNDTHAFCEGYATACSIHKVTGWTVHVCFSCHSMPKVAKRYVGELAVVCADNDDAGLGSAKKASDILCCSYYCPPNEGDDYNDSGAETLSGVEGKNFNSLAVDADPVKFLQKHAPYLKTLPKSLQLIQAERFRADHGITKELFKNIVSEATAEEDGEEREEALTQFRQYYVCEDKLYRVDVQGRGYWRVSRDEVKPLVEILAGENGMERNRLWQDINGDRRIDRFEAKVVMDDASLELTKNESGATVLCSNISLREVLLSAKRRSGNFEVPLHIREKFKTYHEVVDCFKACLYRKVLGSTKSTLYFRTCSDYGKTFFFDVEGLSLSIRNDYDATDFSGVDSANLARYLFLFIDEAKKFTTTMKKDIIGYDRKYGGYQTLRLPMRLMACANEVPDIEEGADEQILKRVTTINPKVRKLDEVFGNVDHTLHKRMWDAYILDVLIKELDRSEDFAELYDQFLERHRGRIQHKDIKTMLCEAVKECYEDMEGNTAPRIHGMELVRHIHRVEGGVLILSPSRTLRAILEAYKPDRLKAFGYKYSNIRNLCSDLGTPHLNHFEGKRTKSVLIPNHLIANEDGA